MTKNVVVNQYDKVEGMLLYTAIQKAVKAYQKPGTDPKPDEWKVSVVLTDEDYVDELEEWATKNDCKLSLKKVKTTSFEETYKVAPPESAGKNIWVWTLRKSTELGKTGNPVPPKYRPKVYQRKGNTLVDVTNEVLVGNGSMGVVSTDLFVRNNGSVSIYLKNVLVTDLVEYVSNSEDGGSEFGVVTNNEVTQEEPKKAFTKKPSKVETEDGFDEDQSPF
jgi:hypothetical protein